MNHELTRKISTNTLFYVFLGYGSIKSKGRLLSSYVTSPFSYWVIPLHPALTVLVFRHLDTPGRQDSDVGGGDGTRGHVFGSLGVSWSVPPGSWTRRLPIPRRCPNFRPSFLFSFSAPSFLLFLSPPPVRPVRPGTKKRPESGGRAVLLHVVKVFSRGSGGPWN